MKSEVRNPYYGKYIKNGKCKIIIEHKNYDELIEFNILTGEKTKLKEIEKTTSFTKNII